MTPIIYKKGDATVSARNKDVATVICHCCNAFGGWGRGFVIPLGQKYPKAKSDYENFCKPYQSSNELRNELMGQVCLSKINEELYIANIIGQYFYSKNQKNFAFQDGVEPRYIPTEEGRFVNYEAIRKGFNRLSDLMDGITFNIQMPKMGCGLAGGDWQVIECIICEEFCSKDIQVTVYEL